ncbi:hypothetical protein FLONG3_3461 [Fusarium longipes]|uniref:Uncharacterized protein n=1 Tax=Fusarium longipes TaxID=694270 RepID=A0A395T280_9HYPO|nr:hypothetical protein FLONG3_3461 [Fusarium longipes]
MVGFVPDPVKTHLVVTHDRETLREIDHLMGQIVLAHKYFQRNIEAGNLDIPNCQSIKPRHLKWIRWGWNLHWDDMVWQREDRYQFPDSWIKEPGVLDKVLEEFDWYAGKLVSQKKGLSMMFWLGIDLTPEEMEKGMREWESEEKSGPLFGDLYRNPRDRLDKTPFVTYEKFKPVVPYKPTEEELADIERRRRESEACGTPSEQTARCFLFDRIEESPSARAALEKQAREDPKAAFHLELLKKKKAAAGKAENEQSRSRSEDGGVTLPEEEIDQEDAVRRLYTLTFREEHDVAFEIELPPTIHNICHVPVSSRCPQGILIDL